MKQSSEELAFTQQVECDFDEKAYEWFSHSVEEMNRRSAMTPREIWEVVKDGGHHFFASIDEMIADCGSYRRPRNRDELSLCLVEYSSKLDQLSPDPALQRDGKTARVVGSTGVSCSSATSLERNDANIIAAAVGAEDEVFAADDDFWVGACNEMFHAMSRVLRRASSRAANQAGRAADGGVVVPQRASTRQRVGVAMPDNVDAELHETARDHFALMVANGKTPRVVVGGESDGLAYFPTSIAGDEYCLTNAGLLMSPTDTSLPQFAGIG